MPPFDRCGAYAGYWDGMDVKRIIDEIGQLQEMFEAPDIRPNAFTAPAASACAIKFMRLAGPWRTSIRRKARRSI